ncbi:MAG TPA: ABC-F family ATP-binding cassette domain-containing protein [Desulfotignum sp.]|nr:ABC-F family ATP-binding cassette domain-containing protein [Desulfotignum sp.]
MSVLFSTTEISKTFGDDTLFSHLSFDLKKGEHLGLIGSNGSGKSTLLKIIAGMVLPDSGEVAVQKGQRIVYLDQEDFLDPEQTVEQTLFTSLSSFPMDEKERHRRINQAMGKGRFADTNILVKHLSGGWKKRLSITRSLCMGPDLLLLDEPTNHLDISGILWLEQVLVSAPFSYILVSHDRAFLENVCTSIMEMGKFYAQGYFKIHGSYQVFEKERQKFLAAQKKQQASLASKMRREDQWLRQGPKARTSKARFRIDQADKLRQDLGAVKERNRHIARVDIDFTTTGRQTRKLIQVHNLTKGFGQTCLFSGITFELGPGVCMGVVGENGSGKSTFLSLLEKKAEPDLGTVKWAEGLKIAVYDQDRTQLDPEILLRDALNPAGGDAVNYLGKSVHVVTWAKRFLFLPEQLDMPVKRLSGGEKARIILAGLMLQPADVLLLDEPTNDLDILSLEVLEQSIQEFAGAVVIVSHDRYLMDRVCHRILYLDPAADAAFYRDFNQILKARNLRKQAPGKQAPDVPARPAAKKPAAPKPVFSYKDKYELEHMEENILAAEACVQDLHAKIQDPDFAAQVVQMTKACEELEQAENLVQELYTRWQILEQKKADAQK